MKTSPLDAAFGIRLHLESADPLDRAERAELRALLDTHGLIVIRDGEISREQQIDLVSAIGRVEPDETGKPMEMEVTNQHDQSTAPDGELVFHYDYAYDPATIPAISMYGLVVGEGATSTLFVSSKDVIDRLPHGLLARISGREASHACFLYPPETPDVRAVEPDPIIARGEPGWGPAHYWTHHPVVWQNASGVETLFLCLQHTDRILGLTREESDEILQEAYEILYEPKFVVEHAWREGDLVLWDNITVQHARPEPKDAPRTLRRFHVSDTDLTADYVRVARERGYM
jgi:taurine dioxygenase